MTWLETIFTALAKPFQWWVVVAPWEQALRVRLGKVAAVLQPGIHFRIPFLDRVYRESLRLRTVEESGLTVRFGDGRSVVTLTFAAVFRVCDLLRLFHTLANPESVIAARVAAEFVKALTDDAGQDLDELCRRCAKVIPVEEWGLADLEVLITSFAICRAYRIIGDGFREWSALNVKTHDQEAVREEA